MYAMGMMSVREVYEPRPLNNVWLKPSRTTTYHAQRCASPKSKSSVARTAPQPVVCSGFRISGLGLRVWGEYINASDCKPITTIATLSMPRIKIRLVLTV